MTVLIVGPLASFDILMANALERHGIECLVVRETALPDFDQLPAPLDHIKRERVILSKGKFWLYKTARKADHIISFSGSLPFMLGKWWIPAYLSRSFPPIVNHTTGSDMTELIRENSRAGKIYRSLVRKAKRTILFPYPEMFESARRFKIVGPTYDLINFPYFLPNPRPQKIEGPIVYFHPSHLDWGATDSGEHRNSTKGNDRFLKAFLRALSAGANVRCIILDRGPDRVLARQMTEASGFGDRFEWRANMTQKKFAETVDACDVVVDQFSVGGFGGIAIESMSKAKPVMIYVDEQSAARLYSRRPPILNCRTEDDIFRTILANQDRSALIELGRKARTWAVAYHDDADRFLSLVHYLKGGNRSGYFSIKSKHEFARPKRDYSIKSIWEVEDPSHTSL